MGNNNVKALTEGEKFDPTTDSSKYVLPDEQVKNDESVDEDEPTDIIPPEHTEQLAIRMADVQKRTISDTRVKGEVVGIGMTETSNKLAILVDVPAESDPVEFHMDEPPVWSARYQFVRFVEHYGFEAANMAALRDEEVEVEIEEVEDGYALVIPEEAKFRHRNPDFGPEDDDTGYESIIEKIARVSRERLKHPDA